MSTTEAILSLDGVRAGYGAIEVLKGVSLSVRRGEIVTLLGANGAGKSTVLGVVSGLVAARAGTVLWEGRPLSGGGPHAIVRAGISHVPEGRRIFPRLTVRENLSIGAYLRDVEAARADAEDMLALFPILRERANQLGGTLSGGEQQMLAIARGLMSRPKLLLLDEPSLGLAPLFVARVAEILRAVRARGVTMLLVEQNAHMALALADRAYVLETGRVTLSGPAAALRDDPRVKEAYLGG